MFGIQERERIDLSENVTSVVQDAQKQDTFKKLPDYLVVRFKELEALTSEYETLKSTQSRIKLPTGQKEIYRVRISVLETEIKSLWRIAEAIRQGYEPYTMSPNFHVGSVDGARSFPGLYEIEQKFNAPMPETVIKKYERARRDGLFDRILVGSADQSLFANIPAPLTREPVMVGYIPTGKGPISYRDTRGGLQVNNLAGFLIAQWDLGVEVKAALKNS